MNTPVRSCASAYKTLKNNENFKIFNPRFTFTIYYFLF